MVYKNKLNGHLKGLAQQNVPVKNWVLISCTYYGEIKLIFVF